MREKQSKTIMFQLIFSNIRIRHASILSKLLRQWLPLNYFIFLFPVLNNVLRYCLLDMNEDTYSQIFIHTTWIFLLKWKSAPWPFLQLLLNFQLMLKRIELEHDMHMSDCACIVHSCQKTSESSREQGTQWNIWDTVWEWDQYMFRLYVDLFYLRWGECMYIHE